MVASGAGINPQHTVAANEGRPLRGVRVLLAVAAYQKNCRRASRILGLSLTKARLLVLYFLLSTIT